MKTSSLKYFLVLLVVCSCVNEAVGVSVDKDLTLTVEQKAKLDKFRSRVSKRLEHDYMKEDIYLIRWLRARNFDVNRATEMLDQHLKWRRENKMDTVHEEDWTEYEREYPIFTDAVDRDGRPIYACNFGEWDIRRAVIAGKLPRLMRWLNKGRDEAVINVRKAQAAGKNVTQWNFIFNMDKLNLNQHLCPQCMQLYTDFSFVYENHYPGSADKIILINTPQVFELVLTLIRPILSQATRDALKVYGRNKEEWEPKVFAEIDRDQLPPEYGGTRFH